MEGAIQVSCGPYEIFLGSGLMRYLPNLAARMAPRADKFVVITDTNLEELYGQELVQSFQQADLKVALKAVPPGENSKCRAVKAELEDWMFEEKCGRDVCIVAFGGGVVGDLAGYVAATYMRGVPFIQVPTSLLAMVDSSVGGKTGIDTVAGKNLLGAFYHPLVVIADVHLLQTLPLRHLKNGLVEAIKAGAISSSDLFELIESSTDAVLNKNEYVLLEIVRQSVTIKADVVREDFKEKGKRSILNFGHTIGHAIESILQPRLLHGECVAIGMIQEAILARSMGFLQSAHVNRLHSCLHSYGLPTAMPQSKRLTVRALLKKMALDKKNKANLIAFVILTGIGSVKSSPAYVTLIDDSRVATLLCRQVSILSTALSSQSSAQGSVAVPGSKSISNRVLLMAAMGVGECRIHGLLHSEDTQVMLASLRQLGVYFKWENNQRVLVMQGSEGKLQNPSRSLFLNNAGTAARFLTTLCATLENGDISLTGNHRMKERPIGALVSALNVHGQASGQGSDTLRVDYLERKGSLPIRIKSYGGLQGGVITLASNTSSQYVSSILLSAPYAKTPITLKLDTSQGPIVSKPYIDMTLALMKDFGVVVRQINSNTFFIPITSYTNPPVWQIEGDASSSTYPLSFAAVTGGSVTVNNVGSASLQGDSHFCQLLQQMGCKVSQTATTTTVEGPPFGSLVAISDPVDMDSMTDSFMTLAAVAACAQGTTTIVNISNQRVKECDRIAATVAGLRKMGIESKELRTGIEIKGLGKSLRSHVSSLAEERENSNTVRMISCFNDHRIAMSFGVLGSVLPGVVLDSQRCVDKTYPTFWDDIRQHLNLTLDHRLYQLLEPIESTSHELRKPKLIAASLPDRKSGQNASIVIIGMRGAGKTSLGKAGASHELGLGWNFLDIDHLVEQHLGMPIKDFAKDPSTWHQFRQLESKLLKETINSCPSSHIISCGGGIVETPEALELLKSWPMVVQVHRHIDDIVNYLNSDPTRPSVGEIHAVWERRKSLYKDASDFEFCAAKGDTHFNRISKAFGRFLKAITCTSPLIQCPGTFFLSLTFGDVHDCLHILDDITEGSDAIELRVDLLSNYGLEYIQQQINTLRQHSPLPIIFTVRSESQGGKFPDDENRIFDLLKWGVRNGCQWIDMESHWSQTVRDDFISNRRHASVIASHHFPTSNGGSVADLARMFHHVSHDGRVQVIKVVTNAQLQEDALRLISVANEFGNKNKYNQPLIVLAMSQAGQISRVLNQVLTPVTHEKLPSAAAPGQLSVKQIMRARQQLGMVSPKRFHIFGTPVSRSPSPLLHNTGFRWCNLPYVYSKCDTADINVVKSMISNTSDFGGASVTMPFKEAIIPLVDQISDSVQQIGSMNTIIVGEDGVLYGDNTDWIGIYIPFQTHLSKFNMTQDFALVIGAGGTARAACFALKQLGFANSHIIFYNPRTPAKAVSLARHFKCAALATSVLSLSNCREAVRQANSTTAVPERLAAVICTLPGTVAWTLPYDSKMLNPDESLPVVLDVSYVPKVTALARQVKNLGLPLIRGIDMLIYQGHAQFAHWTNGRRTPFELMESTVRQYYQQLPDSRVHRSKL